MDLIDVETELRSSLATRPVPRAPADLAERTRVRHRRQRRQQAAVAGVGLAVALVFGSVPALRAVLPDVGTAEDAAAPRSDRAAGLYEQAPRGSLAGDTAWLEAVAALPWDAAQTAEDTDRPPLDSHRVVYADEIAGMRVALVVGTDGALLSGAWFTGPSGAEPGQMSLTTAISRVRPREPVALVDVPAGGASGVLFVVGLPGDQVEYLAARTVTADGEEQLDRRTLPGRDGVAAGEVDLRLGGVTAYVRRDGRDAGSMSITLTDRATAIARAPVERFDDPRGLRGRVSEELLQDVLLTAVGYAGLGPDEATPVLLAAGASDDGAGEAVLVGLTFPSGATLLSVGRTDVEAAGTTMSTHTGTQPAGVPLVDRVLAVPLDSVVALSGPPDAVAADVLDEEGMPLATVPLTAGSGVASGVGPARSARFLGSDGAVLAEAPVSEIGR